MLEPRRPKSWICIQISSPLFPRLKSRVRSPSLAPFFNMKQSLRLVSSEAVRHRLEKCDSYLGCLHLRCVCAPQRRRSFLDELTEVRLCQLDNLLSISGEDRPRGVEGEALGLLKGDLRWQCQLLACHPDVNECRTLVGERRP